MKKVFQIAKELGIDSKAIVAKCKAEDIPNIDTHMSPISAGLEATIKEWFTADAPQTAVETSEHLDLQKVRKKAPYRGKKGGHAASHAQAQHNEGNGDDGDSATAVAEPPSDDTSSDQATSAAADEPSEQEHREPVVAEAAVEAEVIDAPTNIEPVLEARVAVEGAKPVVSSETVLERTTEGSEKAAALVMDHDAGMATLPIPGVNDTGAPAVTPMRPAASVAPVAPVKPVAPVRPVTGFPQVAQVPQKPVRPGTMPPQGGGGSAPVAPTEVPQKPVRPPVAARGIPNVVNRPVVTPVGTRVAPAPATLQGPRVVRMEQPDNLPTPRARQRPDGPGQGQGQGQGPGMGQRENRPGQGGMGGEQTRDRRPSGNAPGSQQAPSFNDQMPLTPSMPGRGNKTKTAAEISEDEEQRAKAKGRSARRKGGRSADAGVELIREWREADLADRAERIASASGVLKERRRELTKSQQRQAHIPGQAQKPTHVEIEPPVTVRALSEAIGVKSTDILKKLMAQGTMATVNQVLDADAAVVLALEFGIEVIVKARETAAEQLERESKADAEAAEKIQRPPVVTILGHVDHGKTSLLDKIRSANVAAGEAGGITQHVGAYTVNIMGSDGKEKRVTFLDTPGHQAFTAMRARGANMTDVVVLVVAADDGVMPQTVESINHAKAAGVPIVVAMNKIDKPEANPNKVLGQLAENGLNPAEWGGDTEVVRTSATTGQGVKELIEYLDYVATLRELKASPELPARGAVIEAFMDPNRGVVARVLVQNGTLHIGDIIVCGQGSGRVRQLIDDKGKAAQEAGPATPVEVIGLDAVPGAGDAFYGVDDLITATTVAEERQARDRAGDIAKRQKVTLDNLFATIQQGDVKELRMILKADVQGSVDVLKQLMTEELSKEVKVRLLHAAVGGISESDVLLAEASKAIVVGFNVVPDETARKMAEALGVEVRLYRIIYEITDDIRKALTGMLAPSKQDQTLGHAEIRQVIKVSRVGNVAGCQVTDGVLQRNNKYRLIRDGVVVAENLTLDSLKRFKEDVKEVRGGLECGIKIANYDDVKVGDRVEAYKTVDVARSL